MRPHQTKLTAMRAALLLVLAAPALAHHSVTATYDTSKVITLDGLVREFDLGSPHSHLVVDVAHDGRSVAWHMELAAASFLRRAGWTERSLTVGERVRLTGSPARSGDAELYVVNVTLPDGSRLSVLPQQ
jgi:hypothetical protein